MKTRTKIIAKEIETKTAKPTKDMSFFLVHITRTTVNPIIDRDSRPPPPSFPWETRFGESGGGGISPLAFVRLEITSLQYTAIFMCVPKQGSKKKRKIQVHRNVLESYN